ncbi:lipoprotein LpqH, partial [Mycolicibacterium sp. CBMA 361]
KNGTTYTISGTATGVTAAIPPVMVSKPFEIKVTCP